MNQHSAKRVSQTRQLPEPASNISPPLAGLVPLANSRWAPAPTAFRPAPFLGALNETLRSVPDFRHAGASWLRMPGHELGAVRIAVGYGADGRVSHSIFWTVAQAVAAKLSRGAARKLSLPAAPRA